ncbi:hypothetical protein BMS3Bbin13_00069 [bacterium BMS3Bbin13]|nr:hypothetical protein BMS3Bbin13_00069 [bacterium BMS3Bbin13]
MLENLYLIHLDVKIWSGRRKLRLEDLHGVRLPEGADKVASLGSKKVISPEELLIFSRLKNRAERACREVGVRFLGGVAVPKERFQEALGPLNEAKAQFDEETRKFLSRYEQACDEWVRANPEWMEVLDRARVEKQYVSNALDFSFQVFQARAVGGLDEESGAAFTKAVNSLPEQLFQEIAADAQILWERTSAKDKVTQRAVTVVRRLHKKLQGLAMLDAGIGKSANWVERGLNALPKAGNVEGNDLRAFCALVLVMQDKDALLRIAQGEEPETNIAGIFPADAPELPLEEDSSDSGPALAPKDDSTDTDTENEEPPLEKAVGWFF